MRSRAVAVRTLGVLVFAGACATSGTGLSWFDGPARTANREPQRTALTAQEAESAFAQAVADRDGPRGRVHAVYSYVSSSRYMRAAFSLDEDAYVIIGHVDADGVVRIVFPQTPQDDGFLRGNKTYQSHEFFAGFTDAYRFRYRNSYGQGRLFNANSYDGQYGYLFMVASWRPMHFEKLSDGARWDSFELDEASYSNPEPAIRELAALLNAENREAYTLSYATYVSTRDYSIGSMANSYMSMCRQFGMMGFASSPFDHPIFASMISYGSSFYWRGSYYRYDALGDCYSNQSAFGYPYSSGYGYGYNNPFGYRISGVPQTPSRPRLLTAEDSPRHPGDPRSVPRGGFVPTKTEAGVVSEHQTTHFSPEYRQRGLITESDPPPRFPFNRNPRTEPANRGNDRPSIQQMIARERDNGNEGSVRPRNQTRGFDGGSERGSSTANDSPRSRQGDNNARSAPSETHRAPVTRGESAPRFEAPRAESRPSAPPPSPAPRSESKPAKPPR